MRKIKTVLVFITLTIVAVNLLLGFWGISSIILTAIIYAALLLFSRGMINVLSKNDGLNPNLKLLFTVTFISLFICELSLKYIFKVGLEAQEIEGDFFYSLPYGNHHIEQLARKHILKLSDPFLINRPANSSNTIQTSEFTYIHNYNTLGLRGKNIDTQSKLFNIVTLGDSYTEGIGAAGDSTWTKLLEDNLNDKRTHGLIFSNKVQCINGGLAGSDPFSEYYIFKKLLLPAKPKIVLLSINGTDITDVIKYGGFERYTHPKDAPWWAYIYQFSYIHRALMHAIYNTNWLLLTPEENRIAETKAMEKIVDCINNYYIPLATQHQFELIIVLHPMLNELEKNEFQLSEYTHNVHALSKKNVVNLFDQFKSFNHKTGLAFSSIFWKFDGHHNAQGYLIWSNLVAQSIVENHSAIFTSNASDTISHNR